MFQESNIILKLFNFVPLEDIWRNVMAVQERFLKNRFYVFTDVEMPVCSQKTSKGLPLDAA
jgi:hypothetical protein